MVATVSRLHGGNATYYTKSYYLNGQADGEWLDTGASSSLRIADRPVTPRAFERLLLGFHPSKGEPLVQNAGGKTRQLGWDLQFAVDKSFSVLHALVPEIRDELEASLKEAVRTTVREVFEPEFLETRRGQGGRHRERVTAPVATFLHRTNRENEIHLHCHAAIPNVGLRADGTWGTIVSWNLYDAKLALGKAFHARYAEQVSARLGIACEFDEHGLSRVRGFLEHVAEALSTPTRRIAEVAEDETARAKEEANLRIRRVKASVPFAAVEEVCRERAARLGFTAEDARGFLAKELRAEPGAGAGEAARALVRAVVEAMPPEFSKAQLFEHAFREGARAGHPFAALNEAIRETLADEAQLQPLGHVGGQEQYRKVPGPEQATGVEHETHEEELRAFLKQIIEATPELSVAEFLPCISPDREASALGGVEEVLGDNEPRAVALGAVGDAGIAVEDILATFEPLGTALRLDANALDALIGAVQAEMGRGVAPEATPLDTASVSTTSPELRAYGRAQEEAERAAGRFVRGAEEAAGLPEAEARSLLREALAWARAKYAERLVDGAIADALRDITGRQAHFARQELTDAVAGRLAGKRAHESLVQERIGLALEDRQRVVAIEGLPGGARYTTSEMLRIERDGIEAAEALQGRSGHREDFALIDARLARLPGLSAEERQAVLKAVRGTDLALIRAGDGSQMKAVQRGIREALREGLVQRGLERASGRKDVLWVAPTATAARELERGVGAEHVATLQKLLHNLDRGVGDTVIHHGRMVVHAALKRPTWDAAQLELTPHTTVILDSAGLADTRQFSRLLQHAERAGARVIACGTHGLPSLGPGGLFKELCQRSEPDLVAILSQAARRPVEVGRHGSREEAKKGLIEKWALEALKRPERHTIVAASRRDVHELNAMAQERRKAAGLLGFRSIEVRYDLDGRRIKERIYEGDRVVFTARTDQEVINGVFGTIKHIDLITGRITVRLDLKKKWSLPWEFDRQQTVTFQYRKYRFFRRQEEGFRLGYAATVYRSQNVQVEGNSYCLVGGPDGAASAVYAGLGLARGETYFFGDNHEARAKLLEEKETAHAVMRRAEEAIRARELERDVQQRHAQGQGFHLGW